MIITSSIQGTWHDHTGTVLLTVASEQLSAGHAWPESQTYATTLKCLAAAYEHTVLRRQSIPASESYRRISSPSFPDAFLRLEGCHQDPRCISDPQQRKSAGHNQPSGDSWTCTYIQDMSPGNTPRCTGNIFYSLHRAMTPGLPPSKKAVIKMYMQRYVGVQQQQQAAR